MTKIRRIISALMIAGTSLLLSGCQLALLDPKGIVAAQEKHIMLISTMLMLIVVIPTIALSMIFVWRYRASNTKAVYSPEWSHSLTLEFIWWTIPCIICTILGIITWNSSHRLDPYHALAGNNDKPITIEVIALEWKWLFIYPEQNIATVNFVEFPANMPVKFEITAEGPMNSFQIPQLAGQIYAMDGMKTKLNLIADQAGDYKGMSASFSGDGFSDMTFVARATSQDDFNKWVKTVKQSPLQLTESSYADLMKPSERNAVAYYSAADKDLFGNAIMKSMMPMPMPKAEAKAEAKAPAPESSGETKRNETLLH